MVVRTGSASRRVGASPDAVFAGVTDIERLPEWNAVIQRVTECPAVLKESAEWVVEVKPSGMPKWLSRSTVVELDEPGRRFRYRSATDDGNPSFADWEWHVEDAAGGASVTVSWELHPKTFARKVLLSRIRDRALRKEAQASIEALGAMVTGDVA